MNSSCQHSAIESLNQNLVPGSALIDGRTEIDQLAFLTEYASLLNFYDSSNKPNGSWQPFLLKDPVFLTAFISRTPVSKLHAGYRAICDDLQRALNNEIRAASVGRSFNQLFNHLTEIFNRIERWSGYMLRSPDDYKLKQFVLGQTISHYSASFWAVQSLRDYLSTSTVIKRIEPVVYYIFDSYDEIVWKQNRGKSPFWEILGFVKPIAENTPADFFAALVRTGDDLYTFLQTIVTNAVSEYQTLSAAQNRYPDTTLLRTGVNLLTIHRNQLNSIAGRHLDFYYRDILKQSEKFATPDRVFVCAELAQKTSAFSLPAQTGLNAGVDASKNPVVFNTLKTVSLNPAAITQVYTLSSVAVTTPVTTSDPTSTTGTALASTAKTAAANTALVAKTVTAAPTTVTNYQLDIQQILTPGVIQKNEAGQIQGWDTFGGSLPENATAQILGFAFASPLLLLREGSRSIQITLNYTGEFTTEMLQSANVYLSTKTAWLNVTTLVNPSAIPVTNPLVVGLVLDPAQPPIEAFTVNPDGVLSSWPMFKITFDTFSDLVSPPVISELTIKVAASGVKTLQLSNDYGGLNAKTPFQLFGPTPLAGSSFIIGSNEIFSKPLDSLCFEFDWDKLPDDFNTYYQQYNAYIADPTILITPKSPGIIKWIFTEISKLVKKILGVIKTSLKVIIKLVKTVFGWIKKMFTGVKNFVVKIFKIKPRSATKKADPAKKKAAPAKKAADPEQPGKLKSMSQIFNWLWQIYVDIAAVLYLFKYHKLLPYTHVYTEPFNNICFTVDFNLLQDRDWKKIVFAKDVSCTVDVADPSIATIVGYAKDPACELLIPGVGTQLFNTDGSNCTLQNTSVFSYPKTVSVSGTAQNESPAADPIQPVVFSDDANPKNADPSIQNSPLVYSTASSSGFLNVVLNGPEYGFGSGLYSNVVSNVALKNAALISHQPQDPKAKLILPPNPPFAPKLKSLTVSQYQASDTYQLTYATGEYPIQCYHYSPFANYLVYDNTREPDQYWPMIGAPLVAAKKVVPGVSLYPHFEFQGALIMALENLVFPCELSIYFELSRTYGQSNPSKKISAYYLCDDYWQPMSILADGTNNLRCSGIITVNIKNEISENHFSMPSGKYWLAFCTHDAPADFPQTAFLKTNGVEAQRAGTGYQADSVKPELAAGTIAKTQLAVPSIASIVQPFASFGGRAAENKTAMNRRISNRIKTKDRCVTSEDINRLINQEFDEIYYSKVVLSNGVNARKATHVYVARAAKSANDPGAFVPLVTPCQELKIQNFLAGRTSVFSNLYVSCFNLEYVQVSAAITVKTGFALEGVIKQVNQLLNIFLSPWIPDAGEQVCIDQSITAAQVNAFIKSVPGVETADQVTFQLWTLTAGKKELISKDNEMITPSPGVLFVSDMKHSIYLNTNP
ncbi:MAG: hypothetical protein HYZ14_07355 [Bacteroidetes bacterium]|nr:hypothetical protein [Bacteroidota bacterium]